MDSKSDSKPSVVVIGGGTGSHTVLTGLKQFSDAIAITAVISMADSGGSTGRLRDEFGQLPVGDVRMALTALAESTAGRDTLLRRLFLHRFDRGDGLVGHNVGNLLLVALTDMLGSETAAIGAAADMLQITGRVLPVTEDNVQLVATYDDGVTVVGEQAIDDPGSDRRDKKIVQLSTDPVGTITPEATAAILGADAIVIGPGDLYSSLLANIVIDGVAAAIQVSPGKLIFISSLMERPGQTRGVSQSEIAAELCRYIGRCPDVVCMNNAPIPEAIRQRYVADGTDVIRDDASDMTLPVIRRPLLAPEVVPTEAGDTVARSLIRHDGKAVAQLIMELLQ